MYFIFTVFCNNGKGVKYYKTNQKLRTIVKDVVDKLITLL